MSTLLKIKEEESREKEEMMLLQEEEEVEEDKDQETRLPNNLNQLNKPQFRQLHDKHLFDLNDVYIIY